ncbi:streptomycin biosynthesis protein [Amycolatopsis balhimycina DSM 5908]|uniref:Streptomycin biosynthesis protein n=3 Tax=Amycolatopsis balhimycina TaxID=208443 RepID=A0A428X5P9_AMYBA|nr:winged helix-turn-helix transcriptional regulator [Amycolatopsis balhimycina]RSM50660.1 streptomycin biosynthesis protein [Amycolatopsis balhimycina DSM 5908]CAG25754.1 StrR family transcriptional regulator [Amycolatopsis balhimycina DSM 5908]
MDPTRVDIFALPAVEIELSRLSSASSPRTSGEDPEHVETLLSAEGELPPILVHRPTMQVLDGLHRLKVARVRGDTKILARLVDATESDAFVLAVEANIRHGLPLSLADRKRAAVQIIGTHPQWSDRRVASATGISAGTVADLRRRAGEDGTEARIGRDGRVRPSDGSERRRLAAELIRSDPGLSLRQVAKQVGISPETVRDVRGRLERGESPTPDGTRRLPAKPHPLRLSEPDFGRAVDQDRLALLERLKSDPALRLNEVGRILLRMLTMHSMDGQEWERILQGVPPHLHGVIAGFARDHARVWAEFADHLESRATELAAG